MVCVLEGAFINIGQKKTFKKSKQINKIKISLTARMKVYNPIANLPQMGNIAEFPFLGQEQKILTISFYFDRNAMQQVSKLTKYSSILNLRAKPRKAFIIFEPTNSRYSTMNDSQNFPNLKVNKTRLLVTQKRNTPYQIRQLEIGGR